MEPCQAPIKQVGAPYSVKIYCLWRGNGVKSDIPQNLLSKLTAIKCLIQTKRRDTTPLLSWHHMCVIEQEHSNDLRSAPGDDSFELSICEDTLHGCGNRFNEDICVQVRSNVFENRRSRDNFFDSVRLLLSFLTDVGAM
jgi:hypothetical protein